MCQRAAAHQQVAQQVVLLLGQFAEQFQVFADLAMGGQDADAAVVPHKFKHALNGGFVGLAFEADLESEVAGFGVHAGRSGNGIQHGDDVDDLAQGAEVADEGQRVHAVAQHVGAKTQREVPVVRLHRAAAVGGVGVLVFHGDAGGHGLRGGFVALLRLVHQVDA